MYSIPAPVIKTILDYCDLPSAITFARVTKRCNTIFNQCREEILIRGEYVNVPNMFQHCSDEFIIQMSKHKFFDNDEARKCCNETKYRLCKKLGFNKLYSINIDKKILREIYEKNDYNHINAITGHKVAAAKIGIDLDIPYPDDKYGLQAALLLRNELMINKLKHYGNFYIYCITGYYHLADNYEVDNACYCINNSINPMATFEYIEKRGYKFKDNEYYKITKPEVLKIVIPRIKKLSVNTIFNDDYDLLILITNKLLEFTTIDVIFGLIVTYNIKFIRYLLQNYPHLTNKNQLNSNAIYLLDLLDNEKIMKFACKQNRYTLIRALVRRNGRQWAQQFDHPFIKKYYM